MRRVVDAWRRIRLLRRRSELERGLDDEIRFHIERQAEKHRRAGIAPDEARRRALIDFGGVERAREGARDELRLVSIEDMWRDVRHGARALLRAPAFAVATILTLAVGVGATTAMFSIVNGVLLRPLPYPAQDRLVELVHEAPGIGIDQVLASPAVYFGYRDHSETFEAVGLWDWDRSPSTVTGRGDPEPVQSVEVTHEVLSLLGTTPILGRTFTEADDAPGSTPTALISYGYWQRRFGGADPLGEPLVVDGVPRQVVGVLPQSFRFFDYPADLFYPLQPARATASFPVGDGRGIARVKPGVTLGEANADVARMIPILDEEFPGGSAARFRFGPKLRWLKDSVVGSLGGTLWLLLGTTAILLLIACTNVSNLMLVRTQARWTELAVRTALGANWSAIARVVLAEGALVGLAGGIAGVAVAYAGLPLLLTLGADDLPQIMTVAIDRFVLLIALAVSVLSTLLFAIVPAVQYAVPRRQVADTLRGGTRSITEGRPSHRPRQLLVIAQVALALVLLVGCGLMIRSFITLRQVDTGFHDPAAVQTFQLTTPMAGGAGAAQAGIEAGARRLQLQQQIVDRLAAIPSVSAAGFASNNDGLPLDGDGRATAIVIEGKPRTDDQSPIKEIQAVSPGFFETLGTPLIAGRLFDWTDVHDRRRVALVSDNLARAEWGAAGAALGKRIGTGVPPGTWFEIVGVVADVRHSGLNQPAPEMVIFPAAPQSTTASFVVRSARVGTSGFLDELRKAVWSVAPDLSLAGVRTLGDLYDRSMARTTMTLRLLGIAGTLALVLGLVGIYGIVSYTVSQRRREIGIRLALGARHGEVRRMFVRNALGLVSVGVVLGLGSAAVLTRLMESQLFGISPLDPLTHAAVATLLVATAALASYASAHRASALDPMEVLKGE